MFRSLRWSLLVWYTALLAAVLIGFGASLFVQQRRAAVKKVDADLLAMAQVLATTLREQSSASGPWVLPEPYHKRLQKNAPDAPYFVIWDAAGHRLQASRPDRPVPFPQPRPRRKPAPHPWYHRDRDQFREVVLSGPAGVCILVGKSLEKERAAWNRLLGTIAGTGAAVLLAGICGGWLLANRLLSPIRKISATAAAISESNLSERIDLSATAGELEDLGRVLNRTFARLESAFERQRRFTADASHELRTPVAILLSQTELALAKDRDRAEYRRALEACHRAARRMKSLTDDLLTLARADSGQLHLDRQPCDLKHLVESCAELIAPAAAARNISVTLELQPIQVVADGDQMARVLVNVLANAVAYNREGGSVIAKSHADGQQATLTITDTGEGIPEELCGEVFEPFVRADPSRSRQQGGSGLGLAICRELIEAHGGTIHLTSRPGQGTTVVIQLPCESSAD